MLFPEVKRDFTAMRFLKISAKNMCPAIRVASHCKEMDALSSDDSAVDFQLPGSFDELVSLARSNVSTLRHLHYPNKTNRKRKQSSKKRGPAAHSLRLIIYHLPSYKKLNSQIAKK